MVFWDSSNFFHSTRHQTEAGVRKCSSKLVFLKIFQILQKNSIGVFLWNLRDF